MELTALVGDTNINTAGRSTSGIETFDIKFVDVDSTANKALTVDTSALAGAKNFNIVSATASAGDTVTFNGLLKDQAVTIKSTGANLDVNLNYAATESAGEEDVASFAVNGAKVDAVTIGADMETVKITATGDNEMGTVEGTDITKVVIDGTGSLDATLGGDSGSIAEINATEATGSLDLSIATTALNATKATIMGGTATDDVLELTGNLTSTTTISGFETVGILSTSAPTTLDMKNVSGATTVAIFGEGALTVTNATGVQNVLLLGDGETGDQTLGTLTFTAATAQDLTVAINNSGVELGTSSGAENVINAGALTLNKVENITINASDGDVVLTGLTANGAKTLTVTATEDFKITDAVTFATDIAIDMAGVIGNVSLTTGDLTTSLTYTGSDAADTLTFGDLAANKTYAINAGAGNDSVTLGTVDTTAGLTLNLGDGDDTLTLGGGTYTLATTTQTIDFGAGSNDTLVYTGSAAVDLSGTTITGLENIKLTGGSAALTLDAGDFTGKIFSVDQMAGSTATVKFDLAGEALDLSQATFNGTQGFTITHDVKNAEDALTLEAGGADIIIMTGAASNVAAANVFTINGFDGGSGGGDVISFASGAFNLAAGAAAKLSGSAGAIASGNDGKIILITDPTCNAVNTAWFSADFSGANGQAVVITNSDATHAKIWYIDNTNGGAIDAGEITLVGTIGHTGTLAVGDFAAV